MMKIVILGMLGLAVLLHKSGCQDIVFPDDDRLFESTLPTTMTKPPTEVITCPPNMVLWPMNSESDAKICDCRPRFVWFSANDSCYEAFHRGPCPKDHYVYLGPNQTTPNCASNSCKRDGQVLFEGTCHPLNAKGGPCAEDSVLTVNETTVQLECVGPDIVNFNIIDPPKRACPQGSKRNTLGVCKLAL